MRDGFGRVVRIELAALRLFAVGNEGRVLHGVAEEVTQVICCCICKKFFLALVFLGIDGVRLADVIEHFFACNDARIADIIHISDCVFGHREEVDERLRRLLVRAFRHDPAVEPKICAFLGNEEVEIDSVLFFGKIHRIDGVAAPCEVEPNAPADNVRLAGIRFVAVNVFVHLPHDFFYLCDGFVVGAVHDLGKFLRIVVGGLVKRGDLVFVENGERHKVGIAHVVLGRHAVAVSLFRHDIPAEFGQVCRVNVFGVVNKARHAPHISRGVVAPRGIVLRIFFVDAVALEHLPDIRGDVADIVVLFLARVEETFVVRFEVILRRKFHDHVLGGAEKIVLVPEFELVVHIFVCSERGVFHADGGAVLLFVPPFKASDHVGRVGIAVPRVLAAFVDVLLPIIDAEHNFGIGVAARQNGDRGERCDCRKQKCGNSSLFHFRTSFLRPTRFAEITTMRMTTKMMVVSAQKEESVAAVCALPRVVALNT